MVGDLKLYHLVIVRSSRLKKIVKIESKRTELTSVDWSPCIFKVFMEKIDHVLGHKIRPNKFQRIEVIWIFFFLSTNNWMRN